jgi:hypothetical protein
MATNSYPAKWKSKDLLKAADQLSPSDVEWLYEYLRTRRGSRSRAGLPSQEAKLLARISKGFSDAWWERYHELLQKRRQESLTRIEHRDLLRLTDQLEQAEAKRVRYLIRLARLRGQSLQDLMANLGLPAQAHA